MKPLLPHSRTVLLLTLLGMLAARSSAQTFPPLDEIKSQAELEKTVTALDAALFDSYNRCDLEKFKTFFVAGVEFYHDQGGVTLGKDNLAESVRRNICGGDVRRELVPGTLEVYPMKGYGALEIGVHRFYHPLSHTPAGEGKFIHLWQCKEGAWKITASSATIITPRSSASGVGRQSGVSFRGATAPGPHLFSWPRV
jgi:Domain of unknown function (DUF4440)